MVSLSVHILPRLSAIVYNLLYILVYKPTPFSAAKIEQKLVTHVLREVMNLSSHQAERW